MSTTSKDKNDTKNWKRMSSARQPTQNNVLSSKKRSTSSHSKHSKLQTEQPLWKTLANYPT